MVEVEYNVVDMTRKVKIGVGGPVLVSEIDELLTVCLIVSIQCIESFVHVRTTCANHVFSLS